MPIYEVKMLRTIYQPTSIKVYADNEDAACEKVRAMKQDESEWINRTEKNMTEYRDIHGVQKVEG